MLDKPYYALLDQVQQELSSLAIAIKLVQPNFETPRTRRVKSMPHCWAQNGNPESLSDRFNLCSLHFFSYCQVLFFSTTFSM